MDESFFIRIESFVFSMFMFSFSKKCKILVFDRHGYRRKSLNSISYKRLNRKSLKFVEFNKVNISYSQLRKIL